MAFKPGQSNESILEELKNGQAQFELISSHVASLSSSMFLTNSPRNLFFARIGPSIGGKSQALKKVESYSVQRVTGDGRCMFRALVKGMALNKGLPLSSRQEREDADELRMAVKEVICDKNNNERRKYEEALIAITVEEPLRRYCQRIGHPDFWGGESELLVLSRLCCQPITVYIPEHEHGSRGLGFIPIAEYGAEFKGSRKGKPRKVVRLLYSGKNHYDLLV
ncbi:cysteine protease [Lithospermum erythrorhizon]|uniref:Ubiquitin thioesterase OTU n=1 Tax=Lithospermum erythrorhizon TaxID=34254 RepID=A0AAV3PYN1_LITER